MAELIWQAANPEAGGHVATYNSGGATVEVHLEAPKGAKRQAVPAWVTVGLGLMEKRIREYMDETGRLPSRELLEDFQKEMGRRLDAYIKEPLKHPFQPMGLREFEESEAKT